MLFLHPPGFCGKFDLKTQNFHMSTAEFRIFYRIFLGGLYSKHKRLDLDNTIHTPEVDNTRNTQGLN